MKHFSLHQNISEFSLLSLFLLQVINRLFFFSFKLFETLLIDGWKKGGIDASKNVTSNNILEPITFYKDNSVGGSVCFPNADDAVTFEMKQKTK